MTPASKKTIPLYQAGMPSTMVSSRPAMTLSSTEFADLTNVRNRYGVIEARKSDEAWSSTGLPDPTVFCGSWSGTIKGVEYMLCAVKNDDFVDIYASSDGHAWSNRSVSSGAYDNTKLTFTKVDSAGVSFQPIHDPVLKEAVLISDGDKTLLWQPVPVNGEYLRRVKSFDKQLPNPGNVRIVQFFTNSSPTLYFTGDDFSSTAFTYAGGPAVQINSPQGAVDSGGTPNRFEIYPSSFTTTGCNQIGIYVQVPEVGYDIFSACKLEMYDGSSWSTIYDPTDISGLTNPPYIEENEEVEGLSSGCILYTYAIKATDTIETLRWSYFGDTNQFNAGLLFIWALVASEDGKSGIPNYAVSYRNSATGVESPPVVLDSSVATGDFLWRYHGYFYDIDSFIPKFPISNYLRGYWAIEDMSPFLSPGFDEIVLYRKDDGSTEYLFTDSYPFARFHSGDWEITSGTTAIVSDHHDETGLDPERPAPSIYNIAPPGFTCASFANGRLFMGTGSEYQFSEYHFPMRCALSVDVNAFDRSGGGFKFASETPKAFFYLSGDANLDRLALATDKATYSISGLDAYSIMRPGRISQFGSLSPKSFGTRRDVTFFLDDARHLRVIPGGNDLDKNSFAVKDILDGISSSRIGKAVGATYDDRYYLFYSPSGSSINKHAFVFDLLSGTLTKDDYDLLGIVAAVNFQSKLLAFMSDGTIRQLEAGTSNVTINISSREIGTDGDSWQAGRQRIYCDDTNSSMIMKWSGFKSGQVATDTISTNADGADVRTDRLTALGKSLRARSVQFAMTGAVPGGSKIYHWSVEQEDRVTEGKA